MGQSDIKLDRQNWLQTVRRPERCKCGLRYYKRRTVRQGTWSEITQCHPNGVIYCPPNVDSGNCPQQDVFAICLPSCQVISMAIFERVGIDLTVLSPGNMSSYSTVVGWGGEHPALGSFPSDLHIFGVSVHYPSPVV
ncbi:hypothetical protein BTVI_75137 [Pitangus sulphuratus]|nr:hypothetical protein BTVI_75137 [Pitangus sulphuratus]